MKTLCLALALGFCLTGCVATSVVATTAKVATKATVLTVGTGAKVATGTASLIIPDGDEDEEEAAGDENSR
jgi:hypothetical protein